MRSREACLAKGDRGNNDFKPSGFAGFNSNGRGGFPVFRSMVRVCTRWGFEII